MNTLLKEATVYDPWSSIMVYAAPDKGAMDPNAHKRKIDIEDPGRFHLKLFNDAMQTVEAEGKTVGQDIPFARDAARILLETEYAKERVLRKDASPEAWAEAAKETFKTQTAAKFAATLCTLTAIGLLCLVTKGDVKALAKHFQIPKGEDAWRIITDARITNHLCKTPPGVNLPHLRNLILEIVALGATFAVVADWRYWFFQLPLNEGLQQLFGIQCEDKWYRMKCLPMGFAWAPRIAQCIGWGIILRIPEGENSLGVFETWKADPPDFVRLREYAGGPVVGLIFLWYDNVFVVCKDPSLRDKWFERLRQNGTYFNARFKQLEKTDRPVYIGIKFWCVKRGLNKGEINESNSCVRWSHDPTRVTKWVAVSKAPLQTPRDVARLIGIIVWHYMVTLQPLLLVQSCIDVMRRVAQRLNSRSSWDKSLKELGIEISEIEERVIRGAVKGAIHNAAQSIVLPDNVPPLYAAVDACKEREVPTPALSEHGKRVREITEADENGAGWLLYGADWPESGRVLTDVRPWSEEDRKSAIHILEARALLYFLEWLPAQPVLTRLVLGEDNTIVVSAVTKGYSSSHEVCLWVKKILEEAKRKNVWLSIIWVPTLENAADPISRLKPPCDRRNEDTWLILHGAPPKTAKKGREKKEKHPSANPQVDGLEGALCRM